MKKTLTVLALLSSVMLWAEQLEWITNGESGTVILLPPNADECQSYAAAELQTHLKQMSGADLPILKDTQRQTGDRTIRLVSQRMKADQPDAESFRITVDSTGILIWGGSPRGTLYGVYSFLENDLGCRWFAEDETFIPCKTTLALPYGTRSDTPAFEYREPQASDRLSADWCARNRVNSASPRFEPRHGGHISYLPHYFCHSFEWLLPPERYFKDHPEYFALVDSKRNPAQLCPTHPEVFNIALQKVLGDLKERVPGTIISISQNDNNIYCHCPSCSELIEQEKSAMGPILSFVNRFADAFKDSPEIIDTLAYVYSEKTPEKMNAHPEAIIRLCSILCCSAHPLSECEKRLAPKFRENIKNWSKHSKRLWIWDYTVNYSNFIQPFPNLQTLAPNLRFFKAHGVTGVFEEGDYFNTGSELQELRLYLLSKLLWNPDLPDKPIIAEFINGYYKTAAKPVTRYLELLEAAGLAPDANHPFLYDSPTAPYHTDRFLMEAESCFDEAEKLAANDSKVLRRVRIARLPVRYVMLCNWQQGRYGQNAEMMLTFADEFAKVGTDAGIKTLSEHSMISPEKFRNTVRERIEKSRSITP